jgi:hypothetical protein
MLTQYINYGGKVEPPTSFVKYLNTNLRSDNNKKTNNLPSFVKTIIPLKNNGSFVKTFNNKNY